MGKSGEVLEQVLYEGYGPGGTAVIVEAMTDNRKRTAPLVRHAFAKFGYGHLSDVARCSMARAGTD